MGRRLTEQVYEETQKEKKQRDERIAWEKKFPKPWFLKR